MKVHAFPDHEQLSLAVRDLVIETIKRSVAARGRAALLIPTGETPRRLYALVAEAAHRGDLDLSKAVLFALDEYRGGHDFRDYVQTNVINPLPPDNRPLWHVLDGEAPDWRAESKAYEAKIQGAGGIDLCLLGVGVEGHVGFNERGSAADSRTRLVDLASSTLQANGPSMKRPYTQAITVGLGTIMASRTISVMASGAKKAIPIGRFLSGSTDDMPLNVLRTHPDVRLFVDKAVLST